MKGFIAGFVFASLLWGGAAFAYQEGLLEPYLAEGEPEPAASEPVVEEAPEEEASPMRRRRRRRGMRSRARRGTMGDPNEEISRGDDLGEDAPREINAAGSGGEEQLSSAQVEGVFSEGFSSLRRCLFLAEGDSVTGRLLIRARITGSGRVEGVNLRGPRGVTGGEAGQCLRQATRRLRFPSFDGPDMTVAYPVTLE